MTSIKNNQKNNYIDIKYHTTLRDHDKSFWSYEYGNKCGLLRFSIIHCDSISGLNDINFNINGRYTPYQLLQLFTAYSFNPIISSNEHFNSSEWRYSYYFLEIVDILTGNIKFDY